ncbi:MAG: ATP-binding cassette domain-containing protein [Mucilaginibacter polytrichastri]|nr:ATP-binding cassette domain-containing protein [Mucilaginibacter polytrichastri]
METPEQPGMKVSLQKRLNLPGGHAELIFDAVFTPEKSTALYGPSGAGKTSVLRMIAGLIQPEKGYIEVNGEVWLDTEKNIHLPPQKRSVGFVFQDFGLFPNMTVEENVRFGSDDDDLIRRLLLLSGLSDFSKSKPFTLSGGQRQRLALIRALARKPKVLLMDEPLSAQDVAQRRILWTEIGTLLQETKPVTILVSHDEAEIRALGNYVIGLEEGRVSASGTPGDFFGTQSASDTWYLWGIVREIQQEGDRFRIIVGSGDDTFVLITKDTGDLKAGAEIQFKRTVI